MICGGCPSKNHLAHKFSGVKEIKDGLTKHKFFPYTEIMRILTTAPKATYVRQMAISEMGFVFSVPFGASKIIRSGGLHAPHGSTALGGWNHCAAAFCLATWLAEPHVGYTYFLAPKTWSNFPVKKLGEDFFRWEFQLVQFFSGENFLVCMIEEPFPGTTSTSEGQSLRSGGF